MSPGEKQDQLVIVCPVRACGRENNPAARTCWRCMHKFTAEDRQLRRAGKEAALAERARLDELERERLKREELKQAEQQRLERKRQQERDQSEQRERIRREEESRMQQQLLRRQEEKREAERRLQLQLGRQEAERKQRESDDLRKPLAVPRPTIGLLRWVSDLMDVHQGFVWFVIFANLLIPIFVGRSVFSLFGLSDEDFQGGPAFGIVAAYSVLFYSNIWAQSQFARADKLRDPRILKMTVADFWSAVEKILTTQKPVNQESWLVSPKAENPSDASSFLAASVAWPEPWGGRYTCTICIKAKPAPGGVAMACWLDSGYPGLWAVPAARVAKSTTTAIMDALKIKL
jgi:hypothetical protein